MTMTARNDPGCASTHACRLNETLAELLRLKQEFDRVLAHDIEASELLRGRLAAQVELARAVQGNASLASVLAALRWDIDEAHILSCAALTVRLLVPQRVPIAEIDRHPGGMTWAKVKDGPWLQRDDNSNGNVRVWAWGIDELLGVYFPRQQRIELYTDNIRDCAADLDVSPDDLRTVVAFHEAGHAVDHLGLDADGNRHEDGDFIGMDGGRNPSPLKETVAQLITRAAVKDSIDLAACFLRLSACQPLPYRQWEPFANLRLERLRAIMAGMRSGKLERSFGTFVRLAG